jgi:hypothetical protein
MKKIPMLLSFALFIFYSSLATATTLVDTFDKKFKKINSPNDEVSVKISYPFTGL